MRIKRIQIEEGFLNGFDLTLTQGLNVFIGARGTGKTSIIELIRYGLNSKNHTGESHTRSLEHARAVLAGGEVAVTLTDEEHDFVVTRSASADEPFSSEYFQPPIVLSQTEIETLGLSDSGRLSLIDGFILDRGTLLAEEARAVSSVRSTYKEINALEKEISALSEGGVAETEKLLRHLAELEQIQEKLQAGSKEYEKRQVALKELGEQTAALVVSEDILNRFADSTAKWKNDLSNLLSQNSGLDSWGHAPAEDPLITFRERYNSNTLQARVLVDSFDELAKLAEEKTRELRTKRLEIDKSARSIRTDLEKFVEGAGANAKNIVAIRTQLAQLHSKKNIFSERVAKLTALRSKRDVEFEIIESIRTLRFGRRLEIAYKISKDLSPHIKIEVERSAHYSEYTKALTNALRGSGIKYTELIPDLAAHVSPKELVDLCENKDFVSLAELIEIPKERAARIIGHLSEYGLADIITCNIEDNVRMTLLDGVEYKDIATLSAGQRCTVVLSIVLQHKERTLIIDQPEDHLDNAFIASTVIKSLRERKGLGQVILSTHNANIPVLGEADLVIELTSDGRNGYIQLAQPLKHPDAVQAITNVMEGGRDAFLLRSKFYAINYI